MKNFFIPYEIACELRRKGFDEECFGRFVNGELLNYKDNNSDSYHWTCEVINAPIYQQVIDWFREKCGIFIFIDTTHNFDSYTGTLCTREDNNLSQRTVERKSYYEALNDIIEEAIKLI